MLFWKTYPFGLYTVRKEIKKNGDFEILHEIVLDTTRISSCFFVLCIVSRTILCRISESPLHFISFLSTVYVLSTPVQHSCAADPVLTQIKSPPEQFIIICKAFACIPPAQSIDWERERERERLRGWDKETEKEIERQEHRESWVQLYLPKVCIESMCIRVEGNMCIAGLLWCSIIYVRKHDFLYFQRFL